MSQLAFTVVLPNARRVVVKAAPNDAVSKLIEGACVAIKDKPLDPSQHTLKHNRRTLDSSTLLRHAGLPNNGTLELIFASSGVSAKSMQVAAVVQLPDGARLKASVPPECTLWQLLRHLDASNPGVNLTTRTHEAVADDAAADDGTRAKRVKSESNQLHTCPTVRYLTIETGSLEQLCATTLRALGIVAGSALLHVSFRDTDVPLHQVPLDDVTPMVVAAAAAVATLPAAPAPAPVTEPAPVAVASRPPPQPVVVAATVDPPADEDAPTLENRVLAALQRLQTSESLVQPMAAVAATAEFKFPPASARAEKEPEAVPAVESAPAIVVPPRDARLFTLEGAETALGAAAVELPETFYDITPSDLDVMLRDARHVQEYQRELLTEKIRNQRAEEKLLQYSVVRVRITLPDRRILQASFHPKETVKALHDFVHEALAAGHGGFALYTTPPRVVLDPRSTQTLADAKLIPAVVIRLSTEDGAPVRVAESLQSTQTSYVEAATSSSVSPAPATAAASASASRSGAKSASSAKGGAQFLRLCT